MRAQLQLRVLYDAPAFQCRRVVRVLPRGAFSSTENLSISPTPTRQQEVLDRFGNRVLHLSHSRIEREFLLRLEFTASPHLFSQPYESDLSGEWKMPSRAVTFSPDFLEIARDYRRFPSAERARKLNELVFNSLAYSPQNSDKPLVAEQVWREKRGTCADFAHVLLALSRSVGMPARYVAGFGPAPGALHAWVEIGFDGAWHGFDPTHGRPATGLYVPVAVGRDFYDCAPHRGVFHGSGARLQLQCELSDGT